MQDSGVRTIDVYHAEMINDGELAWSVDAMCDEVNVLAESSWTWTIYSLAEVGKILEEDSIFVSDDWEIITNKPFSDNAICAAIGEWLLVHEISMQVRMIDADDAVGSGYVKRLREIDLDYDVSNAVSLEELWTDG